jgi:hypothetical protein
MFGEEEGIKYYSIDSLPVQKRRRTDCVCCFCLALFVSLLTILLAFLYNPSTPASRQPTSTRSPTRRTTRDASAVTISPTSPTSTTPPSPTQYPRPHPDQAPLRQPVPLDRPVLAQLHAHGHPRLRGEPQPVVPGGDLRLVPRPKFPLPNAGRIGLFCLPTDPLLKQQILAISNTQRKYDLYAVMDTFFMCAWIAALLGPLCYLLVQFQPYKAVPWVILLGGTVCIFFGVYLLMYPLPHPACPASWPSRSCFACSSKAWGSSACGACWRRRGGTRWPSAPVSCTPRL